MVAKTYHIFENKNDLENKEEIFDLSVKYEELSAELSASHYDTIPSATILQVISMNHINQNHITYMFH